MTAVTYCINYTKFPLLIILALMISISRAFCSIQSLQCISLLEVKKSSTQRGSSEKKTKHKSLNPTEDNQCEEPKEATAARLEESDIKDPMKSLSSSTDANVFKPKDPETLQLQARTRESGEFSQVKTKNESGVRKASNKGIRMIVLKIKFNFLLWSYC